MATARDYGAELDSLKVQLDDLRQLVTQLVGSSPSKRIQEGFEQRDSALGSIRAEDDGAGTIYYSGHIRDEERSYRWDPQERQIRQLLELDGEKAAKVLAAISHKQRLDILKSVMVQPLTGSELVERLQMGTTGQLYHHMKALLGAGLLVQEDRGGKYSLPPHRSLPLLLLLAATSDLLDTSDYIDMLETRNHAASYMGAPQGEYDPHLLFRAVLQNCILEHQAGYCSEVGVFLQMDGGITIADNGRGIPLHVLPGTEKSRVQDVLTDLSRLNASAAYHSPGSEKGITMGVVNALSERLSVEVRREGKIVRQDYQHGIPQSDLVTVGVTKETGTSITFRPDRDIFAAAFDKDVLAGLISDIGAAHPELIIAFYS
ncbi:ArsR family transcriptional regulator [Paenibacillus silviterrae]|uniref:ArsR family transcriptional regulator n=1 Tax=Paenibacillus silviterrae TaxID=3242194 RepID=UPI0025436480|nr:ArsR family transcriptional regulator [Paenibacillus chinjuensis]